MGIQWGTFPFVAGGVRYNAAADGARWQELAVFGRPVEARTRVPMPWVHAVINDSVDTVCGLGTADLEPFPLFTFNTVHPELRCPDCRVLVEQQRG